MRRLIIPESFCLTWRIAWPQRDVQDFPGRNHGLCGLLLCWSCGIICAGGTDDALFVSERRGGLAGGGFSWAGVDRGGRGGGSHLRCWLRRLPYVESWRGGLLQQLGTGDASRSCGFCEAE